MAAASEPVEDISSNRRLGEAETLSGVPIPETVRAAPLTIETREDGFDGKGTLAIQYAPWASARVRHGLQRLWTQEWLPTIKSKRGEGALNAQRGEAPPDSARVWDILFGTNRVKTENGNFGAERASGADALTLGLARVSVPNPKKRGNLPRPWDVLGLTIPQNARKHIMPVDVPTTLSREEFLEKVRSNSGRGAAFLFVHGYNTRFEAGLWHGTVGYALYANGYDRPLILSGGKANRSRAAGLLPDGHLLIVPAVETIDAQGRFRYLRLQS